MLKYEYNKMVAIFMVCLLIITLIYIPFSKQYNTTLEYSYDLASSIDYGRDKLEALDLNDYDYKDKLNIMEAYLALKNFSYVNTEVLELNYKTNNGNKDYFPTEYSEQNINGAFEKLFKHLDKNTLNNEDKVFVHALIKEYIELSHEYTDSINKKNILHNFNKDELQKCSEIYSAINSLSNEYINK